MKNDKILQAITNIDDEMIIEANSLQVKKGKKSWLVPIAACLALTAIVSGGYMASLRSNSPEISIVTPANQAPSGPRKIMNFNGMRYAFLENGASFDLNNIKLKEELGKIENDITSDPQKYGKENFAATYAVGGTIYSLSNYNSDFRLAVVVGEEIYLCESVDMINGEVDLKDYMSVADLVKQAVNIGVFDHSGRTLLDTLSKDHAKQILEEVSISAPAQLTNADYEQIAKAQKDGKSYAMHCKLEDGTTFKFYIIPELGIAMIGDNKYQINDSLKKTSLELLGELKQPAIPMQ